MEKNNYKKPRIEIVEFEKSDIIRTSSEIDKLDINSITDSLETIFTDVNYGVEQLLN